jgi:hypothetical protein
VITQDVTPSLHIDYKNSKIKQYHNYLKLPQECRGRLRRRVRRLDLASWM